MAKSKKKKNAKRGPKVKRQAGQTPAVSAPEKPPDEPDVMDLRKIFDDAAKADESGWGLRTMDVECPHCGEEFEISVGGSDESREMVQDCQVCCRAITFAVEIIDGEVSVAAYQD